MPDKHQLIVSSLAWRLVSQHTTKLMNPAPLLEEPDLVKYSEYDLPLYFNEKTDYRGPPTLEREVMWEKLWHRE